MARSNPAVRGNFQPGVSEASQTSTLTDPALTQACPLLRTSHEYDELLLGESHTSRALSGGHVVCYISCVRVRDSTRCANRRPSE